ncbi:competence protein ComK [Oceanobacillus luteolus]|uniref:Competence protein ComK n=1 Tax=Oceanobacillus luteolus TaxID=1274358 RepID=A0ABW4HTK4_9BACI|nr:competence protein ComK [Oceanobacillus luteolus]MCM3742411.1 competence protein ComK [Oceanobacillus luteolus]
MNNYLSQYFIHLDTMALLPAKHHLYGTHVVEFDKEVFVKDTPLDLIKGVLLHNYSSLEATRRTVKLHTGYWKKVPIPIYLGELYMFPTHAMVHFDCCWIAYHHVSEIRDGSHSEEAIVLFKNGQEIKFPVSASSLRRQRKRTRVVKRNSVQIREHMLRRPLSPKILT